MKKWFPFVDKWENYGAGNWVGVAFYIENYEKEHENQYIVGVVCLGLSFKFLKHSLMLGVKREDAPYK